MALLVAGCLLLAGAGCSPTTPPAPVSTTIDWPADEPVIGFAPGDNWFGESAALVVGPHRWQIVPSPQQRGATPQRPRTTDTTGAPTAAMTYGPGGRPFLVAGNGVPTAIRGDQLRSPGGIRLLHSVVRKDADGHGRTRVANPAGVAVLDTDTVLVATQTNSLGSAVPQDSIVYEVGGYLRRPDAGRSGSPSTKPLSGLAPGDLGHGTDFGVGRVRALVSLNSVSALMISDSTGRVGSRASLDVSLLSQGGTIVRSDTDSLCSGPLAPVAVPVGEQEALITVSARGADGSCTATQTVSYLAEVDSSSVTRSVLRLTKAATGTGYAYATDRDSLVTLARPSTGTLEITWPR